MNNFPQAPALSAGVAAQAPVEASSPIPPAGGALPGFGGGTTTRALVRGEARARILREARGRLAEGERLPAVASALGMNKPTLWRWLREFGEVGDLEASACAARFDRCGRLGVHPLTQEEALALRGHVLAKSSKGYLRFGLAVEQFATHPACRPETRAFIAAELDAAAALGREARWPSGWRRAAYPTRQEAGLFRGRKAALSTQQTTRRAMEWVDESGTRHPVGPHTLWEMDDMSINEPAASVDPETGERLISRQVLFTQDVYSAAMLGFSQVARDRDAYRIEDVADHVRHSFAAHGMPVLLRLEMGSIWAGQFFHGFVPQVPGWTQEERWGGLDPLVRVVNTHQSKGKGGIEGAFNLVQAMGAHQSLSIGRSRGEFEGATRALLRQEVEQFWSLGKAEDGLARVMEWFNHRPKVREAMGKTPVVPADLLRGAKGAPVPAGEAWRLLPVKRLATVRGGHVQLSVDHYAQPFRFQVNGVGEAHLDHGYRVLVAFHPARPEEGCQVFNAELGSRNRDGLRRGEWIMTAPSAAWAPQVDLSGRADFSGRRKASAAVVRTFRAVGQTLREATIQDGRGKVVRMQSGQQAEAPQGAGGRSAAPDGTQRPPVKSRAWGLTAEDREELGEAPVDPPRGTRAFSVSVEELAELG